MKTILTKQLLSDIKKSRNVIIRFNDLFSTLETIEDNKKSIYEFDKNNYSHQSGFWYLYKSDFDAFLTICKPNDTITFVMYENGTEQLKDDGYRWIELYVYINRHSQKNPSKLLLNLKLKIDSMIGKKSSTNFKDLDLHINQSLAA